MEVAVLIAVTALTGCARPSPPEGTPAGSTVPNVPRAQSATRDTVVEVYVPCGVSGPLKVVKAAFEERHPDVSVQMLVEGNVDLVKRLEKGERPDVFANIGDREMDLLVERGAIVPESRVVYATTSLVLVTPRANPQGIRSLADLARPGVKKIALAEPDRVASGYHARRLLQKAGLWEALQPKLVRKPGARGPLNLVLKGQADAAFIYSTCLYEDRDQPPAGPADANPKLHVIALKGDAARVPCVAALVAKEPLSERGRDFLAFLAGPQARAALRAWQWQVPGR